MKLTAEILDSLHTQQLGKIEELHNHIIYYSQALSLPVVEICRYWLACMNIYLLL